MKYSRDSSKNYSLGFCIIHKTEYHCDSCVGLRRQMTVVIATNGAAMILNSTSTLVCKEHLVAGGPNLLISLIFSP